MLFKTGDNVFTPELTPCAIIFKDDEERLAVIKNLQAMPSRPGEVRWFGAKPKTMSNVEFLTKWTELNEEEQKLMHFTTDEVTHIEGNNYISGCCEGEKCVCGKGATHKVEEAIFHDDPQPGRHALTSYICDVCFNHIMHRGKL